MKLMCFPCLTCYIPLTCLHWNTFKSSGMLDFSSSISFEQNTPNLLVSSFKVINVKEGIENGALYNLSSTKTVLKFNVWWAGNTPDRGRTVKGLWFTAWNRKAISVSLESILNHEGKEFSRLWLSVHKMKLLHMHRLRNRVLVWIPTGVPSSISLLWTGTRGLCLDGKNWQMPAGNS